MNCQKCGKSIRNVPDYILDITRVICNSCAVTKASKEDIDAARERALPKSKSQALEHHDEKLPLAA